MKNIILIISFLFYSVSIVYAQEQSFFKNSWKGDMTFVTQEKGSLEISSITAPEMCCIWMLLLKG